MLVLQEEESQMLPASQQIEHGWNLCELRPGSDHTASQLFRGMPHQGKDAARAQFFTVFLARNEFAGDLDMDAIVSSFQRSSSLYHATLAIGALDLRNVSSSPARGKVSMTEALNFLSTLNYQFLVGDPRL